MYRETSLDVYSSVLKAFCAFIIMGDMLCLIVLLMTLAVVLS
jgi:hypothetical protein